MAGAGGAGLPTDDGSLERARGGRLSGNGQTGAPGETGSIDRGRIALATWPAAIEGEGGDQHTYKTAAMLRDLGVDEDQALDLLLEGWNDRCVPPWEPDELEFKVANAYAYALNEAGALVVESPAMVLGGTVASLGLTGATKPDRSRFHAEDEQEQDNAADPTWLIPELVMDASTVLLLGATQSYKSFIALDLALSVAHGSISVFGTRAVRQGPVFYAAAEGRTDLKRRRRMAWRASRGVEGPVPFYVMPAPMIISPEDVKEFGDEIGRRAAGRRVGAIILDTAAKVMVGMNENDAKDVGLLTRFCDSLVEAFNCPVLVIHHKGKDEERGSRGSSAFRANFDTELDITANREARTVVVKVVKHKDAEEREAPWYFEGTRIAGSLAFLPIPYADWKTLQGKEDRLAPKAIGAVLKALGAVGAEGAVTSTVLASAVVGGLQAGQDPERHQEAIQQLARTLLGTARGRLEAYTFKTGRETRFGLPS